MAIVTPDDLRDRFGPEIDRLADRNGDGSADAGVIEAAIADAEAEVTAVIGPAISGVLPDPVPDVLKQLTAVVARYNLCRRDVEPDHPAYVAYKDALRQLEGIAQGRIELPLNDGTNAADTPPVVAKAPKWWITDEALAPMMPGRVP